MSTRVRRRGNRHAQLPPLYICNSCRPGEEQDHRLCVDELRAKFNATMRLCDCDHTAEPQRYRETKPEPKREPDLVAVRGSALPKEQG